MSAGGSSSSASHSDIPDRVNINALDRGGYYGSNAIHSLNIKASMLSLGESPDTSMVCVGGREVFKIIKKEKGGYFEYMEMRSRRLGLVQTVVDLKWHPSNAQYIATSATNGTVALWNLEKQQRNKFESSFTEHTRAVNRICWNTRLASVLATGSQDGTIRIWDIREKTSSLVLTTRSSEGVRDVQFNPNYSYLLGAGCEGGNVLIYDLRKQTVLKTLRGHNGLVLSLDWHPSNSDLLASGGRDRFIKIWNLKTDKEKENIETFTAVGHIQWRPGFPTQIASSAQSVDRDLKIWDYAFPDMPIYVARGHRENVTDFLFSNHEGKRLLTVSKDGTFNAFDVSDCYRPLEHVPASSVALSIRNEMAVQFQDLDRSFGMDPAPTSLEMQYNLAEILSSTLAPAFDFQQSLQPAHSASSSSARGRDGSLEQVRLDDGIVDIIHPLRHGDLFSCESQDFVSLALKYKLTGDRPTRLCALNAEVAKEMGKKDIANLWSTVELLLIEQDDSSGIQNFLAQENKQCQEDRQKLEAELRGLGFDAMGHGLSEDVETDAKSVGVPLNQSSPRMLNVSCVPWGYCSPARRKIGRSPFHSTLQSGHSRHASASPESLALSAHSRISMSASVPNLSSILQAEDRSNSFVGLPGDVSTSPDPLRDHPRSQASDGSDGSISSRVCT